MIGLHVTTDNNIITTGCSFTNEPNSWANYLKSQYDITNVAESGAGNIMNCRNASLEILKNKGKYTHGVFQISGVHRIEIILNERISKKQYKKGLIVPKENYTWLKSVRTAASALSVRIGSKYIKSYNLLEMIILVEIT